MSSSQGGREPRPAEEQAATSNGGEPVIPPRRPSARRFISQIPSVPGSLPGVREIHKNAWLKKLTSQDRRSTPFIRKYERQWVVFCVHDDVEALLEFYSDPKMGATHKPSSTIPLKTCLHVTPSIVGQEKEFEFAVTLPTQVIRLVANTWDQMTEWVESLQGKLREMGILSPKDNVYSKLPETQASVCTSRSNTGGQVTTRDPNSPLPPPPGRLTNELFRNPELPLPLSSVPSTSRESAIEDRGAQRTSKEESATSQVRVMHCAQELPDTVPLQNSRVSSVVAVVSESPGPSGSMTLSLSMQSRDEPFVGVSNSQPKPASRAARLEGVQITIASNTENVPIESCTKAENAVTSGINTSVVEVKNDELMHMSISIASVALNNSGTSRNCPSSVETGEIPLCLDSSTSAIETAALNLNDTVVLLGESANERNQNNDTKFNSLSAKLNGNGRCFSTENVYEYLFIPEAPLTNLSSTTAPVMRRQTSNPGVSLDQHFTDNSVPPILYPKRNRPSARPQRSASSISSSTRSSSLSRIKDGKEGDHAETRTSSSANSFRSSTHFVDIIRPRDSHLGSRLSEGRGRQQVNVPDSNRPLEAMIGVRSGEYRIRRDDSSLSGTVASVGEGPSSNVQCVNSAHIPLKEQQVLRLKSEISHHAGVRIVLRKKDCINSVALVDYLGAVWVAGWKQQQFPVLYYAFHVGDQILKIAGVTVQNSAEAQRAIKLNSSMQVEFVIRRLPYGRVLVIKRSKEGEPLGIVSTGNSGEIRDVQTNSLAANHGLSTNALGTDGNSSPCNWFLTEINNRPLSLFAKESEVRDRLNAVGKEISILVQPADLVKHLRKQLKSTTKNFKDYLVG